MNLLITLALLLLLPPAPAFAGQDSENPFYVRGLKALTEGDHATAEKNLEEAAKTIRGNAHLYVNLGNAYFGGGKRDRAESAYRQAIQIDRKYAPAYTQLGRLYQAGGRWRPAEKNLKQALKIDPHYVTGQSALGWYYLEKGNFRRADEIFDRILEKNGYHLEAVAGKARALVRLDKKKEANYWYRRAMALGYRDAEAEAVTERYRNA
ncbi:MAG: tetratricopeptide repeat protein [Candidatus Omnitrophica bacterium]|nr:tetratricopeptide repeat protein [Candidatus Omnitrophota bacterium]